jgi:hypothetical protein
MVSSVSFGRIYVHPERPVSDQVKKRLQELYGQELPDASSLKKEDLQAVKQMLLNTAQTPPEKRQELIDLSVKDMSERYNRMRETGLRVVPGMDVESLKREGDYLSVTVSPKLGTPMEDAKTSGYTFTGEDMKAVLDFIQSRLKK